MSYSFQKYTSCSKTFSDAGNLKAQINSIHDGQKEENDVHGRYNNGKNDSDFSLPVPQTERPIIKVFRNLWYSIVDYRVPKMFS